MATRQNASDWKISLLVTAAEKFTFDDGRADINETRALIGLIRPFAATDPDLAAFEKLLVDIAEDGVVTSEESAALAEAIAALRSKYQMSDGVYDARTLGLPKMGILGRVFILEGGVMAAMPMLPTYDKLTECKRIEGMEF